PARRRELACLLADVALELLEIAASRLAGGARRAAIARVGGEELRADLRVRALEVAGLVAACREALEQLGGLGRVAGVELGDREREVERERLGAPQDARVAGRAIEVGGGVGRLALAHRDPAAA